MSMERRRYSRFSVHPDEGEVLIQIGATVVSGRIADQSSNGMQVVLASTAPQAPDGTVVWVQTRAGCTEARIIRVARKENELHLGLERLQDVPNLPSFKSTQPWWQSVPTFANWDGRMMGVGIVLVLGVCLAIYWAFFFEKAGASGIPGFGGSETSSAKVTPQSGKSETAWRAQGQMLQDVFQKLPAAQVIKELRLTPQQEVEFRAVLEAVRILQPGSASSDNELARLSQVHERMVTTLSPSQQAYWKSTLDKQLTGSPGQGSTPADRQALLERLFPKSPTPTNSTGKPR